MKEIKAYIREDKMQEVVRELRARGAQAVTVVRVMPAGTDVEPEFVDISSAAPVAHYSPMLKLELVCNDGQADALVETVRETAHTGRRGDGAIFVSRIEHAVHIRSGRTGEAAL
jgi:nitrogen regulatory protein PII